MECPSTRPRVGVQYAHNIVPDRPLQTQIWFLYQMQYQTACIGCILLQFRTDGTARLAWSKWSCVRIYRLFEVRCAKNLPNTNLVLRLFFIIAHQIHSMTSFQKFLDGRVSFRGKPSGVGARASGRSDVRFEKAVNMPEKKRVSRLKVAVRYCTINVACAWFSWSVGSMMRPDSINKLYDQAPDSVGCCARY